MKVKALQIWSKSVHCNIGQPKSHKVVLKFLSYSSKLIIPWVISPVPIPAMMAEWFNALIPNSSRKHALDPRFESRLGQKLLIPKISKN